MATIKLTNEKINKLKKLVEFEGIDENYKELEVCEISLEKNKINIEMICDVDVNFGIRIIFDKELKIKATSQDLNNLEEIQNFNKAMKYAAKDFEEIKKYLEIINN